MFEFTYTESDCEQFCLTDQLINYITYDDDDDDDDDENH